MVFNLKGKFFLNLDEKAPQTAAVVAPVAAAPAKAAVKAEAATATTPAPAAAEPAPAAGTNVLTTAEAIAAELAAADAARPAISNATFAPDFVTAGGALPMRRRSGGANLAGFKAMAGSMFGKK
jgi:cell pole-organizing protein PopZ